MDREPDAINGCAFSISVPWTARRRVLLERQMRASAIVVARVVRENPAEMPLIENDGVVRALATKRPDEPLCESVLPR